MSGPYIAWVGDDFTGASDTLATLATGGARALLFLDVPTPARLAAVGPLEAVGVATAVRSMAPAAMREVLAPIADWLAGSGVPVVHYKVCSTWDSAPGTGNIGEAVRTLWRPAYAPWVPLVGGQPSLGRWCAHGQLFAQAGAGGPVYRIDRHPTMSRHPVTPMGEARLAVHLAAQGCAPVARVDLAAFAGGAPAIDAAIVAGMGTGAPEHATGAPHTVLFDTLSAADLAATGAAIARHAHGRTVLAVGASSVAQAMLARWRASGVLAAAVEPSVARAAVAPARGPVFVLAGSLSPLSARQVAQARAYERVALDAGRLAAGDAGYLEATARAIGARLAQGAHVLAGTSIAGPAPRGADPALAPACGALLAAVLGQARCARVGVVGGDTSSRAVQALAPWALGWVGRVGASSPVVRAHADDPAVDGLELMLKGGQMGEDDVLDRLVSGDAHR
ncbi:MAG: four-carbon acid sugar kinase family protein [Burkholderiales bacterium]|nr:four-carbon acid sugar kinase family protein [Burkholderiales bacterium]